MRALSVLPAPPRDRPTWPHVQAMRMVVCVCNAGKAVERRGNTATAGVRPREVVGQPQLHCVALHNTQGGAVQAPSAGLPLIVNGRHKVHHGTLAIRGALRREPGMRRGRGRRAQLWRAGAGVPDVMCKY